MDDGNTLACWRALMLLYQNSVYRKIGYTYSIIYGNGAQVKSAFENLCHNGGRLTKKMMEFAPNAKIGVDILKMK